MPAYEIVLSPQALERIEEAWSHIARELGMSRSADDLLDELEVKFSVLKDFPEAYPIDSRASYLSGREIRHATVRSFRLLYCVDRERLEVHILSLRFGNENPETLTPTDLQS